MDGEGISSKWTCTTNEKSLPTCSEVGDFSTPEFRIRLEISENLPTQVNKEIEGIKNKIL